MHAFDSVSGFGVLSVETLDDRQMRRIRRDVFPIVGPLEYVHMAEGGPTNTTE